jgi:protein arginine kinase activator
MANPLKCDLCSKPATVHLTQILDNKVHKVDLCEECPAAVGIRCEQCGFSPADFKKQGRFGCPACYSAFKGILDPMLDGMHKGTVHSGKVPRRAQERKSLYDKLTKLEGDLSEAIKAERYEDAARCRDEINQVRQAVEQKPAR